MAQPSQIGMAVVRSMRARGCPALLYEEIVQLKHSTIMPKSQLSRRTKSWSGRGG
jgi:hypothetical protein